MSWIEIVGIAIGLAMDAFAVSLAAAASGHANGPRPVFRLSFHFGLFQFMMPVIGWFVGVHIAFLIESVDHWVAFGLLAYVGIKMIRSGLSSVTKAHRNDPSRGWTLVMLSVATSIDALAVGLSLAVLKINIWYPSVIIGLITSFLALIAIRIGNRLGQAFGKRMEVIGGGILILIGLKILLSHLFTELA
ncbi:MAG: manganese efflux pump MntP [Planctomycetota bacterium]|jgi:putative Mn2+ efflux pump MntP